jgi:alkaline phosphatase D
MAMNRIPSFCIAILVLLPSGVLQAEEPQVKPVAEVRGLPTKIAFGSCAKQDKPQPILRKVVEHQPQLLIYLGDNIYGDTRDMNVLRAKYEMLGATRTAGPR